MVLTTVGDSDSVCVAPFPSETYSLLIIDADAVLASPITFQQADQGAFRISSGFKHATSVNFRKSRS